MEIDWRQCGKVLVFLCATCWCNAALLIQSCLHSQIQPQEISPPPTANLDRSNDKVYENVTGLVKAVIEMSSRIQPAPPEEYVPMVKVRSRACWDTLVTAVSV